MQDGLFIAARYIQSASTSTTNQIEPNMMQVKTQIEITLPNDLLETLDRIARRTQTTKEDLMQAAVRQFLYVNRQGNFLSRKEVCAMLKMSPATLYRLTRRKANPIPHTRFAGRKVVFYEPDLRNWISR